MALEIHLVRHGRPANMGQRLIPLSGLRDWLHRYNATGIVVDRIPQVTRMQAKVAHRILSSDLARAIETARVLAPQADIVADATFREAEVPIQLSPPRWIGWIRLNAPTWALLGRCLGVCLWMCGNSTARQAHATLMRRAQEAARLLVLHAQEVQSVILIGHGFFNCLIARELRSLGWKGPRKPSTRHWGCTTYRWGADG